MPPFILYEILNSSHEYQKDKGGNMFNKYNILNYKYLRVFLSSLTASFSAAAAVAF